MEVPFGTALVWRWFSTGIGDRREVEWNQCHLALHQFIDQPNDGNFSRHYFVKTSLTSHLNLQHGADIYLKQKLSADFRPTPGLENRRLFALQEFMHQQMYLFLSAYIGELIYLLTFVIPQLNLFNMHT